MTASAFAAEVGSTAIFAGVIILLQAAFPLAQGDLTLAVVGAIAGLALLVSGRALQRRKAWGRTALEVAAWAALVLGISALGVYLWAEIPIDPTESGEMQEAGRLGVQLAIVFLIGWILALSWVIRGLRREDLRGLLDA